MLSIAILWSANDFLYIICPHKVLHVLYGMPVLRYHQFGNFAKNLELFIFCIYITALYLEYVDVYTFLDA